MTSVCGVRVFRALKPAANLYLGAMFVSKHMQTHTHTSGEVSSAHVGSHVRILVTNLARLSGLGVRHTGIDYLADENSTRCSPPPERSLIPSTRSFATNKFVQQLNPANLVAVVWLFVYPRTDSTTNLAQPVCNADTLYAHHSSANLANIHPARRRWQQTRKFAICTLNPITKRNAADWQQQQSLHRGAFVPQANECC